MIKLENIAKYYHNEGIVTLGLRNINLEFEIGEFVAITGESGSGKTTLLNVISGVDSYEDGEMFIAERETSHYDSKDWEEYRRDKIGFVFQNYNLIDSFTVLKNIEVALVVQGLDRKTRRRRARDIIKRVGLESHIHHRAAKLSGGQKQRLAIARALAKETSIIVADEPTGNLDKKSGEEIIQLLHEISSDRLVLIVTHNFEAVAPYVTRNIRLFDAEVVEDVTYQKTYGLRAAEQKTPRISAPEQALTISFLGIFGQPKKTIFLLLVIIAMVFFSFTSYGGYIFSISYTDHYYISYMNAYPERLIVVRQDQAPLTEDDKTKIEKLKEVDRVIIEDLALDVSFYTDFSVKGNYYSAYGFLNLVDEFKGEKLYGRMPNKSGEILISKYFNSEEAASLSFFLNKEIAVNYSFHHNDVSTNFTVVGVYLSDKENDEFVINDDDLFELHNLIKISYAAYQVEFVKEDLSVKINYFSLQAHPGLTGNETYRVQSFYDDFDLYFEGQKMLFTDLGQIDAKYNYNTIFVSADFLEALKVKEDYQYTVNLKNSDSAEAVMDKLYRLGYYAMCPALSNPYDFDRLMALPLTIFGFIGVFINLLVIYLLSYVILRAILLSKKRDYAILRTLGLSQKSVNFIIRLELLISLIISYLVFSLIIILIIKSVPEFGMIFSKMRFRHYFTVFVINLILILLISYRFNKYIAKRNLFDDLKGGE
ncbi:MAG: ABC transporter ATP-binding protein [Bacilli bacterium]|nr:ABC transporter ATP-binding protein [Bacilli bacterium]